MARVGAGCGEFFDTKTKSKWEKKVKSQLSKAFQPALTSVCVKWQQFDENATKPVQVRGCGHISELVRECDHILNRLGGVATFLNCVHNS